MSSPTPEHAAKLRALPAKAKRGRVRDIAEEELAPLCRLLEKQGNNGAATARVAGLRPAAVWRIVLNLRATPEELAKIGGGGEAGVSTCPKYDPLPGERRCLWYLDNGGCARSDEFMCVEWMRLNPPRLNRPAPLELPLIHSRRR